MRVYSCSHRFYCGIDLHARSMHLCILDADGNVVVGVECMFAWYWLADRCAQEHIPFVLGHALFMKLIYGAKAKNDKIDAAKIARLLRGGNFPLAYVYPKGMRETRDLLRRRTYLVRRRAEALVHLTNTNSQYNLPPFPKKLAYAANRAELNVPARFTDPSAKKNVELDLALVDTYDEQIGAVELYLTQAAKVDDPQGYHRLLSVPGIGKVLALILLYESMTSVASRRWVSSGPAPG